MHNEAFCACDDLNDFIYGAHLESWQEFHKALSDEMIPLTIFQDEFGLSKQFINDIDSNHMNSFNTKLSSSQCQGEKMNKLTNLTSMTGSVYKMFRGGITYLESAEKVSEFFMRLALTFHYSRTRNDRKWNTWQFIAPIQLQIYNSGVNGCLKIQSKAIPPHIDLDDFMYMPHWKIRSCIDNDGYLKENLETLHFNEDQLRHRAKLCANVLADLLNIRAEDIFVATMKTKIPGIEFVREIDSNQKEYGWRFGPKMANAVDKTVKVKPSTWLLFGLKSVLEIPVKKFVDKSQNRKERADANSYMRIMRKDASYLMERNESEMIFARGYGILMERPMLQKF